MLLLNSRKTDFAFAHAPLDSELIISTEIRDQIMDPILISRKDIVEYLESVHVGAIP